MEGKILTNIKRKGISYKIVEIKGKLYQIAEQFDWK